MWNLQMRRSLKIGLGLLLGLGILAAACSAIKTWQFKSIIASAQYEGWSLGKLGVGSNAVGFV